VAGSQWVEGDVAMIAGAHEVRVRGRALVTVEPEGVDAREVVQEDPMNPTTHLAAALVGAALSVTVYQGSALVLADDTPVEIGAGETRTFGTPRVRETRQAPTPVVVTRSTPAPAADAAARIAELEAQV